MHEEERESLNTGCERERNPKNVLRKSSSTRLASIVSASTSSAIERRRLGLAPIKGPCHSSTERSPEIFCCPECFR